MIATIQPILLSASGGGVGPDDSVLVGGSCVEVVPDTAVVLSVDDGALDGCSVQRRVSKYIVNFRDTFVLTQLVRFPWANHVSYLIVEPPELVHSSLNFRADEHSSFRQWRAMQAAAAVWNASDLRQTQSE